MAYAATGKERLQSWHHPPPIGRLATQRVTAYELVRSRLGRPWYSSRYRRSNPQVERCAPWLCGLNPCLEGKSIVCRGKQFLDDCCNQGENPTISVTAISTIDPKSPTRVSITA